MAPRIIVDDYHWQHKNHIHISLRKQHSVSPCSPVVWNYPLVYCPSMVEAIQPSVPIPASLHSGPKLADSIETIFHSIEKYRERLIESPYPAQRLSPSHVIPQLKQRNDAYSNSMEGIYNYDWRLLCGRLKNLPSLIPSFCRFSVSDPSSTFSD